MISFGGAKLTPGSYHVKVEHGCDGAIKSASYFQCFDPGEKGEHEEEDGDGFVIVGACYGTGDISRYDADERGGE